MAGTFISETGEAVTDSKEGSDSSVSFSRTCLAVPVGPGLILIPHRGCSVF